MAEPRAVRFTPGTMVPAGEYRNCDTAVVRYFDGSTPIPGSANSASWEQVSDHYHHRPERAVHAEHAPPATQHHARFGAGTLVPAGEYRNCDTGAVHYFDGSTPLPGKANSASWEQVSDHYHHHPERTPAEHATHATAPQHAVRFAPGTVVAAGEYRNCETGAIRFFDGSTSLPGTVNSASWEQIHDHYMPHPEHAARAPEGDGEAG
ncbi:MAG TPA: hypothetical protein VFO60_12195 [Candidatus Dormibacteraeota bacterium]|nr:hypothetical protein [Candidatus Dormibacteraeota bacterium]